MRYLPYAGIGSRKTPNDILEKMTRLAQSLDEMGFLLRSGGAAGADLAFEKGTENREIYVPGYPRAGDKLFDHFPSDIKNKALQLAERHHPGWNHLSPYVKKIMGRNAMQILGANLQEPSKFVLFWAKPQFDPDGKIKGAEGGTGLAVRLAYSLGIPCYHVDHPSCEHIIQGILEKRVTLHDLTNTASQTRASKPCM